MRLHEVISDQDQQDFLLFPVSLYRNDPNWIRPLDKDIAEVFDPEKNKFFKKGECIRWLLRNEADEIVGRVACFVNPQYKNDQPTGGIGFFECIDDQAAANLLFDRCKQWLAERGMEAMDGPINFGERDRWWGLQIEGFQPPLYCMNYNLPYYRQLFENYGFQKYFDQICFAREKNTPLEERFFTRHAEIARNPDFTARHIRKGRVEQFAKDFAYIYNKAWVSHGGGKTLEERAAIKLFRTMKPVMDEKLIWFAYHKEEPIAMWVNLPDLNQFFKHLDGQFSLFHKLKFLWLRRFGNCDRFVGIVFGVIPQFQGRGVDSFIIVEGTRVIQPMKRYERYEMQWIGDFNPKMINIAEHLDTHRSRILATYRYLFDRNKEFQRHRKL